MNRNLLNRCKALPLVCTVVGVLAQPALAFENAKVMPKGVNRFTFRFVNSLFSSKTNDSGTPLSLGNPIQKDLTFADVLKNEKDALKRELTAGFMAYSGYSDSDVLGTFTAEMEGRVSVFAPILARGITDRVTLALAVPVYDMALNTRVGFESKEGARAFRASLVEGYNNQVQGARDFVERINDAVDRLNNKLVDNGYRKLEPWQETGLGDIQALAKVGILTEGPVAIAGQAGVVLPTGRVDDPDILNDAAFGDGQWDTFLQFSFDQPVGQTGVFFNQYAKYTYQFQDTKEMRLKTAEESIEVDKAPVNFKLGNKFNAGASVQYGAAFGLTAGAGYNYFTKESDRFEAGESSSELEKDTFQQSHEAEFSVGYSGVPAFRRKEIPVPFEVNLSYKHQLDSQNMPVTHFVQLETGMFF